MKSLFLSLGFIGSVLGLWGTVPQIIHLYKVKNCEGMSLTMWYAWIISSFILLVYAVYIKDIVFMFLQTSWVLLCGVIIAMIYVYRRKNETTA